MSNKPPTSIKNLLVLLVVFNFIIFIIYQGANPSGNLWVQLWNYFESNTFRVVTASLVLPIILFVSESRFKIVETIEKNRLDRERKEKEELREGRLECLELTSQMWNQLFSLASEVGHYKKDVNEEASIENIIQRLENFSSWGEEIVLMWGFRFPNLSSEDIELFVDLINMLGNSTVTVAYCIQESDDDPEKISELQDLLLMIQGGIKTIAHHDIIKVLEYSMDLLYGGLSEANEKKVNSKIEGGIERLKSWSDGIKMIEREHNKILPSIGGKEVEAFRDEVKNIEECMREHPKYINNINKCERFDNFKDLFYKISLEKRVYVEKHPYSIECLRHSANWLNFEIICLTLRYEAKQQD